MVLVASLNSTNGASEDLGAGPLDGPLGELSSAASDGSSEMAFGVSISAFFGDFFAVLSKGSAHWLQKREFSRFSVWHFGHFIRQNSQLSDWLVGDMEKIHETYSDTIRAEVLSE
jgi:hypothetical protein